LFSFGAEYLVFHFLIKNIKIKIYRNIIMSVLLYGREIWSLTLREERRLRVFENSVMRKIFDPTGDKLTGNGENYIMNSLIICTLNQILFGCPNREE